MCDECLLTLDYDKYTASVAQSVKSNRICKTEFSFEYTIRPSCKAGPYSFQSPAVYTSTCRLARKVNLMLDPFILKEWRHSTKTHLSS